MDTIKNPIPYTNLIATPLVENLNITFAITDIKGQYRLNLRVATPYKIEISHLGFSKLIDTVNITQDTKKTYTLQESSELLEQVIINQKMAIIVKEDTIIYRTDQFKTGEDRKLREVLKRLPGVEVDRDGNVKVNGKKVTKLMVEGKTFFTGDTKLAVNNIPADAVDEIVVLDNYSEVAFLKGLIDSDQMALNIILKEGKKEFVFGDLEAGGGVEERFLLHPTLFYYGPKTAINVIGDINNIGKKSFTLNDYINFEGGFASLLEGSTSFTDLYNSDFAQFLNQENFVYQKNDFGAGSISQQLSPTVRLEAFSIVNKGKTDTQNSNTINYLTDDAVDENRETFTNNNVVFTLNKFKLRYQPDTETDLAYDAFIKTSKGDALLDINSFTTEDDSTITNTLQQLKNVSVKQEIRFNKQFSYEHTSTITANYSYSIQENDYDWLFNQPVFNNLIPFEEESGFFNILQNTSAIKHQANINLKHYWILDKFNHIYPRVGLRFLDESFTTLDSQLLQDGSINGFQENGFNNDTNFRLNDNYIGLQYKVKTGNFIFKPGLMYHFYFWKVNQFSEESANKQKSVLLPELNMKYELSSAEKIEFDYQLKTGFSNVQQYANRLRLASFNQLYQGNEDLENELYHAARLSYRQFNLYKGVYINANLSYTKREKSIRNTTQIEGIEQINTSIYTSLPENSYVFTGSFGKQLGDYRLTLLGNLNLTDYTRIINDDLIDFKSNNHSYTLKAETHFKDWPNFEIGWEQQLSNFKSENSENKFTQINPYATLDWDFLNGFILSADYSYNYYKNLNTNQINQFNIGNLSLYYNQEDSPWGFEIDVDNIFDVRYKNENFFNQFLIMDTNIFIQPRTILFILSYKF
ncbi:MAG: hypothetical protein L3J25_05310 [Flavobacteriaceae bacterium]|nr:hypothetical protein [Flavobacteriaceae bacterium]